MKKFLPLTLLTASFLLASCGTQPIAPSVMLSGDLASTGLVRDLNATSGEAMETSSYTYTRQMTKPSITEMTNRTAINAGFTEQWTTGYLITQEFVDAIKECFTPIGSDDMVRGVSFTSFGWDKEQNTSFQYTRELTSEEMFSGNIISLTGNWHDNPLLSLSETEKTHFRERGWTIVPLSGFYTYYPYDYSRESSSTIGGSGERNAIAAKIGGSSEENARYPFNTLLITDDMLLHVYHKLFDNGLKYYEEKIARPTLVKLAEKLYKQYLSASDDPDNNYAEIYQFLAAYRAVPHIFLPTNDDIIAAVDDKNFDYESGNPDLTDAEITQMIQKRTQTIAKTLAPTYQKLIPQIVEKILQADEPLAGDAFLAVLADDVSHVDTIQLKQDYTQFKPRAHYTDSSLLKTYFSAMKWLMREKFYFASPKLTQAAFVMVDTISDTDLQELNQLSEQIKHLIGADDDVTLNEMKTFVKQYVFGHESIPIPTETMELLSKRLSELHPQKIQSTPYQTESVGMTTEEAAKRATEGFVFFGEKFTLDSYLFDLMTAGSAEQEFAEKPNIQTALMIPDVLADNAIAHQLVLLWLNEKLQQGKILENASQGKHQLSRYDAMKEQAKAKIDALFNDDTITDNVYHKWLKMLGLLIQAPLENAPYFRLDALYQLKNLVAYLGSYTELKHDTLLYVKQAYAEMGAGGDDSCKIYVENPPLPIPKGYVESEPEFLDKLIQLNEETLPYFDATSEQHKFVEFGTILKRLKEISIKQMHNEIISDEDFEWLRLLPQRKLPDLLQPTKTVGEPTIKEHRVALIADIFTSEGGNPLYEAIGRPALMLLMVNDVNGARVVIGPVFTHYEFYGTDNIIESDSASRYTDEDRQEQLGKETENLGFASAQTSTIHRRNAGLSIVSKALQQGLKKTE